KGEVAGETQRVVRPGSRAEHGRASGFVRRATILLRRAGFDRVAKHSVREPPSDVRTALVGLDDALAKKNLEKGDGYGPRWDRAQRAPLVAIDPLPERRGELEREVRGVAFDVEEASDASAPDRWKIRRALGTCAFAQREALGPGLEHALHGPIAHELDREERI